jgi:hypothetical protein
LQISKHASEKRELVKKLAALEKHIDGLLRSAPKNSKDKYIVEQKGKLNHADGISEDTLEELRKFEPTKLLKALADNGVIFSPEDFIKYLFGTKALKNGDTLVSKLKGVLPGIFSAIADDASEEVNDDKYEPEHGDSLPKGLLSMVQNLFDDHSMFERPAHGRIMKITIIKKLPTAHLRKHEESKTVKEASVRELAQQYASYKLAALRYLDEHNKLDDEFLINALVQNR